MRRIVLAGAALLLLAGTAPAEVDVRATAGLVTVRARSAPLSEVLDRIARQTGMKVVYEGPAPRPMVNAVLENRTPAEAVLGVLEGLGLNYALQTDATGARVETLLLTAPSAAPATRPGPPVAPGLARPADEEEEPEPDPEPPTDEGEEVDEEEPPGPGVPAPPTPPPQPGVTPALIPGMVPPSPVPTTAPPPTAPVLSPPIYSTSPFAPKPPIPATLPQPQPEAPEGGTPEPAPEPTPSPGSSRRDQR
jgi:hypothetical protein